MCWTPKPGALQPLKAEFSLRPPPQASLGWQRAVGIEAQVSLHHPASLHGLPWLHLLDSVSFVHLAIGLLAQPLYFWKPALDNLILSPRHRLSGTLFSPQSKSSSPSCPSPPAGITVPAIKITLSELHGKSHFTLGLSDQPTGQTRASENTMGTLSPPRSPALPGRERHLPHKLAHVDIPHGHTRLPVHPRPSYSTPLSPPPPGQLPSISSLLNHQTL